jgi:hypothetical protein
MPLGSPALQPFTAYRIVGYGGMPAGADVYVLAEGATSAPRAHLVVINDRDGRRIAAIEWASATSQGTR